MEELYEFMRGANSVLEQRVGDEGGDADAEEAEPEELPEGVDPAQRRREKEAEVCAAHVPGCSMSLWPHPLQRCAHKCFTKAPVLTEL